MLRGMTQKKLGAGINNRIFPKPVRADLHRQTEGDTVVQLRANTRAQWFSGHMYYPVQSNTAS